MEKHIFTVHPPKLSNIQKCIFFRGGECIDWSVLPHHMVTINFAHEMTLMGSKH